MIEEQHILEKNIFKRKILFHPLLFLEVTSKSTIVNPRDRKFLCRCSAGVLQPLSTFKSHSQGIFSQCTGCGSNLPDVHIYRLSRHSSSIFTGF